MMPKIAITGATGFLGSALAQRLVTEGYSVRCLLRQSKTDKSDRHTHCDAVIVGDLAKSTDYSLALKDIDCIVHCAALVHKMNNTSECALASYRLVNVEATKHLAEQAAKAGVSRFVFVSTVKVNGERSLHDQPFTVNDFPRPEDPYSISKWEAECELQEISMRSGLEVVIVRPPLVYGVGMKGNLARLLKLTRLGIPLPFGALQNNRSLIGLNNLVDFLVCSIVHPKANGEVFLVSDDTDISTSVLIQKLAGSTGQRARLIPVPKFILKMIGLATGKSSEVNRLVENLQVDISHTKNILNWSPPFTIEEELSVMEGKNDKDS